MAKYLNTKKGSLEESIIGLVGEAKNPAQQAAIAIAKKEKGEEPKTEKTKFDPKQVKVAIGIASDERYAGGNMTGAVKQIEKIAKGLSDHPQVAAVLRRQNEEVELTEREDTAMQVARALKKMGVKPNAKEADIIKKIPDVLKKMGLGNDKLIKRDPDFIGDVLDSMNEEVELDEAKVLATKGKTTVVTKGDGVAKVMVGNKEVASGDLDDGAGGWFMSKPGEKGQKFFNSAQKIADFYAEEKDLDPVNKKALKKDFDDRKDQDLDNDGDTDKTDKYLHKRRQAITKAVAKEETSMIDAVVKHISLWEKAKPTKEEDDYEDGEDEVKGSKTMTGKPKSKVEVDPKDIEEKK